MKLSLQAVLFLTAFFLCTVSYAQTAKEFYKTGVKLKEESRFNDAVTNFTRSINLDSTNYEAYAERAACYDELKKFDAAADDYLKVVSLKPGKLEYYIKAGEDYLQLENYKQALDVFIKSKSEEVTPQIALSKIKLKDFEGALFDCNNAINKNRTNDKLHFYKAMACDSIANHNLVAVESYKKAIEIITNSPEYRKTGRVNAQYMPYFRNLANAQVRVSQLTEALYNYNTAITLDPANPELFCLRGVAYSLNSNFPEAMNDFNKAIAMDNLNYNTFYQRGLVYEKIEQYQNAVNDFSKAIAINQNSPALLQARGDAYEGISKFDEAIKDYRAAISINGDKKYLDILIAEAQKKLFEKNRESNKPVITFSADVYDGKFIRIPYNKPDFELKGKIRDESKIEEIKIDSGDAVFKLQELNPEFKSTINNVNNKQQITVTAKDIYGNVTSETYNIIRIESDPPLVSLSLPEVGPDRVIYPEDTAAYKLYIEGKISDESKISSVIVNGKFASFSQTDLNPTFSATIDIANTDSLKIIAADSYGNESVNSYFINWKGAAEEKSNPMGRTWVVFVENANYENFLSLEGPTNDVSLMKSALANYKIDKVITKRDMNKERLERYFSIELRDEVKKNRVGTLIIWYAGHGILYKENGFWIPVDAKKDDEYSYFLINNLKGYLATYSQLVHLLVISDACETGPAFYLAMRDADKPRRCGDWELTKFKSAQVLASANSEKASDNSILAKTFASELKNNPDNCISLNAVASKVISAIKVNQKQNPVFGNINGLENQDGSFFFIRH